MKKLIIKSIFSLLLVGANCKSCREERNKAYSEPHMIGAFIPQCETNKEIPDDIYAINDATYNHNKKKKAFFPYTDRYKLIQTEGSTSYSFCVNQETGERISKKFKLDKGDLVLAENQPEIVCKKYKLT